MWSGAGDHNSEKDLINSEMCFFKNWPSKNIKNIKFLSSFDIGQKS